MVQGPWFEVHGSWFDAPNQDREPKTMNDALCTSGFIFPT